MKIRKATKKDINILSEMNHEFQLSEKKLSDKYMKVSSVSNLKKRITKAIAKRNIVFLIVEIKGEVIGFSKGLIESYKDDYEGIDKVGFLAITYVRKKFRRKGIGMALYKSMLGEFKKKKVDMVTTFHYASNKPVIEFSKKRGFKVHAFELRKFL